MNRSILYVDDELDNLLVFEAAFEDHFDVWTASSGERALELMDQHPFPVVVADQRMPGMTGAELFEILRRKHPHSKRIMLTGYAEPGAMLDAINQGQVYYFIKKPWERDILFSTLVRAMESYHLSMSNMALTDRLVASDRCATLGRTAAQVAHEMGNQLCILPLLELIENRYNQHQDLMQTAAFARQMYEKLVSLINEIKAFVRFEQEEISRQQLLLSEAAHELVDFLRYDSSLPINRVSVEVKAEPIVCANKVKLQQVLVNLLKNAAHAIRGREDGAISLTVDQDETGALVIVKDNGCGMTPETARRIWEPFFTTKGEEGNGLGLDIAKLIVENHGGQIDCETKPNCGATFRIWLPLAPEIRQAASTLPTTGYVPVAESTVLGSVASACTIPNPTITGVL